MQKISKSCEKSSPKLPDSAFYHIFVKKLCPQDPQSGENVKNTSSLLTFSLVAPSHPKGAKWRPKVSQMGALGSQMCSKWSHVAPQGLPRASQRWPKCLKICKMVTLKKVLGYAWGQKWPRDPPGSQFRWILSDFWVYFM